MAKLNQSLVFSIEVIFYSLFNVTIGMTNGEVAVKEQTCIGNGAIEVGRHSSSSLPLPSPAVKRVSYSFTAG